MDIKKEINYGELEAIMDQIIEHANIAKFECQKENPDLVTLCNNAIEDIGNLLSDAESCIKPFD